MLARSRSCGRAWLEHGPRLGACDPCRCCMPPCQPPTRGSPWLRLRVACASERRPFIPWMSLHRRKRSSDRHGRTISSELCAGWLLAAGRRHAVVRPAASLCAPLLPSQAQPMGTLDDSEHSKVESIVTATSKVRSGLSNPSPASFARPRPARVASVFRAKSPFAPRPAPSQPSH